MVVPVEVLVDQDEHLVAGAFLPVLGIDGLRLHAAEEPLHGGVVGTASLRAHRTCQPVAFHEPEPSGPPVVASTVGVHQGLRPLGQRLRGLDEHPVGQFRVGTETGRVRDDLAVVAVYHRRKVHIPVAGLDLGDVRDPFHVRRGSGEIPVDQIVRRGRGLALVRAVAPTPRHMLYVFK